MTHNLGTTTLKRKRRTADPMETFDGLPSPLRQWLSEAALPWSPRSARKIWLKSLSNGLTPEEALARLEAAEAKTLARDRAITGSAARH